MAKLFVGQDEQNLILERFDDLETQRWFKIDQITGFVFGSMSTRFWMQRQGILNQIFTEPEKCVEEMPFYSWECITI